MATRKQTPSLTAHGSAVNLVLLVLLGLFMTICAFGAAAGLDTVRRHEPVDLMGPAWFVASSLGFVSAGLIALALLATMVAEALGKRRKRREDQPQ